LRKKIKSFNLFLLQFIVPEKPSAPPSANKFVIGVIKAITSLRASLILFPVAVY